MSLLRPGVIKQHKPNLSSPYLNISFACQVCIPHESLQSAAQCLNRLNVIFPQLPPKMQFHVHMAHTDYLIRTAEQNPDLNSRLAGLKQALKLTQDSREFAERKNYNSLFSAADRRIEYLEEHILHSPIVVIETEMSSSQSEALTDQLSDLSLNRD